MRDAGVNTKEELNLLKIEKLSEEVRDSFNTSRNKIETIETAYPKPRPMIRT